MLLLAANPIVAAVVGASTLLAQKVLQDPIESLFSYEYKVTGSWTDPVVVRVDGKKATPDAVTNPAASAATKPASDAAAKGAAEPASKPADAAPQAAPPAAPKLSAEPAPGASVDKAATAPAR
jgi:hypothetical protein